MQQMSIDEMVVRSGLTPPVTPTSGAAPKVRIPIYVMYLGAPVYVWGAQCIYP